MKKIIIFIILLLTQNLNLSLYSEKLEPSFIKALVNFIVTDYDKIPEQGAVIEIIHENENKFYTGITDIDGKFSILLPLGKTYQIIIKKFEKTFDFGEIIEIPDKQKRMTINQPLEIRVVTKYIRTYTLENVYFDFNKHTLKSISFKSINALVKEMKKNTNLVIEIAGHTDNIGKDDYNRRLSQRRANSVRKYLLKKGILKNRIISKGYGETSPVTTNKTKIGRQRNRRVEIRIIQQ